MSKAAKYLMAVGLAAAGGIGMLLYNRQRVATTLCAPSCEQSDRLGRLLTFIGVGLFLSGLLLIVLALGNYFASRRRG